MEPIVRQVRIRAPLEAIWAALTQPAVIHGWMGADSVVQIDLRVGGRYRLFAGDTSGTFETIDEPTGLAYTWRQAEWPADWADSRVQWHLTAVGPDTLVSLTHENLPNQHERDMHDQGWDLYFLGPMKNWLETDS
jgi:uncharacterized protein YndB with AHSA1/START domain